LSLPALSLPALSLPAFTITSAPEQGLLAPGRWRSEPSFSLKGCRIQLRSQGGCWQNLPPGRRQGRPLPEPGWQGVPGLPHMVQPGAVGPVAARRDLVKRAKRSEVGYSVFRSPIRCHSEGPESVSCFPGVLGQTYFQRFQSRGKILVVGPGGPSDRA
jgi:hypothetical protein